LAIILYEFPIVASKTKKSTQSFNSFWRRPSLHSRNLFRVSTHTLTKDNVAKILYFRDAKDTFAPFGIQLMLQQQTEDNSKMLKVQIQAIAEN